MKRKIILSSQYKKDIKLARRRHLPEEELNGIVLKLANDVPLPIENKDHPLKGDYIGYRECHIQSDWLLIYRKTTERPTTTSCRYLNWPVLALIRICSRNSILNIALLQQCERVSFIQAERTDIVSIQSTPAHTSRKTEIHFK